MTYNVFAWWNVKPYSLSQSVCITFENVDEDSTFLVCGDISTGKSQVRIWRLSGLSCKKAQNALQCKTSIENNAGSIVRRQSREVCVQRGVYVYGYDGTNVWPHLCHVAGNARIRGWFALDEKAILR